MKVSEIEPGQVYAIRSTAVRRAARQALKADPSLKGQPSPLGGTKVTGHDYLSMEHHQPGCPGVVLETGVPCAGRMDGVKAEVWRYKPHQNWSAVLVVHVSEVLKRWDEHELNEDITGREQMLALADSLEEQARKIREEWDW